MQGSEFNQRSDIGSPAVKQPQITASFSELAKANAELEQLISRLVEKLEPVIRREPEKPPENKRLEQDTIYNTAMAVDIFKQTCEVRNHIQRICKLLSLLEI